MICLQCGTENPNSSKSCSKCGRPLRSAEVNGVVTCKNHGKRAAVTICDQCLRPICAECTAETSPRTLCVEDGRLDLAENENERIFQLAVADPATTMHAGFGSRLSSLVIDLSVLLFGAAVMMSLFWLVTGTAPVAVGGSEQSHLLLVFWCMYGLVVYLYVVVLTIGGGQTFGKQAMRTAVVQKDGTNPTVWTASLRFLYGLISLICLGGGYMAIIKDPQKRAWHDAWANTYVISLDEATERL